jgi:hypothetical protein
MPDHPTERPLIPGTEEYAKIQEQLQRVMTGKEAAMTEWTPGLIFGVLMIGVGVLFCVWRYGISEWRAHRRDRREERRDDLGPR